MNDSTKTNRQKRNRITLIKNIGLCLNFGFGTLIKAEDEMEFRNSVVAVHNGCELLMKYYLREKDHALIYAKPDYRTFIQKRKDLVKSIKSPSKTIEFSGCIDRIKYFTRTIERHEGILQDLNHERNVRVHYEYTCNNNDIRRLLVGGIYEFILELVEEIGFGLSKIMDKELIEALNRKKKVIDDDIKNRLLEKIEKAKHHYYKELSEEERVQKKATKYKKGKYDEILTCPACSQLALLTLKAETTSEQRSWSTFMRRRLRLKELSCLFCALYIDELDELRSMYGRNEVTLEEFIVPDFPKDCPDDCYDDCPDEDCIEDCPDEDCMEDCPDDDCPDDNR